MIVRFYERLADAIGREIEVNTGGDISIGDVRRLLLAAHPDAADYLRHTRAVLRDAFVDDVRFVSAGDQVEFLPPVSGG